MNGTTITIKTHGEIKGRHTHTLFLTHVVWHREAKQQCGIQKTDSRLWWWITKLGLGTEKRFLNFTDAKGPQTYGQFPQGLLMRLRGNVSMADRGRSPRKLWGITEILDTRMRHCNLILTVFCYKVQIRNEINFNDWSSDVRETKSKKIVTNVSSVTFTGK